MAAKSKPPDKKITPKTSLFVRGHSVNQLVRDLIKTRKWTDEQICDKVAKAFPDRPFKKVYCSIKRWDLEDQTGIKYEKMIKYKGKLIPKSKLPGKNILKNKIYTAKNDPLNKLAGIIVKTKPKKAVKRKTSLNKKL